MKKISILMMCMIWVSMQIVSAEEFYVRPADMNTTYGSEDGSSYTDSWKGLHDVEWARPKEAGKVGPGDDLYVCGLHIYSSDSIYGRIASMGDIYPVGGTSEDDRVTIRGDCPGDNGIIWGSYLSFDPGYRWNNISGRDGVFRVELVGNHPKDWYFQDITEDSWTVLDKVDSIDAVENSTEGAQYAPSYANGENLYVKCSDGGNPEGRIALARYGYGFNIAGESFITFKNLGLYGMGAPQGSASRNATHITYDGCTMLYGTSRMIGIQYYNGNDAWDVINCEIAHAGNAIYTMTGGDARSGVSDFNFSNNHIHDIGIRESFRNGDAHAIGLQGGENGTISGNLIERCGTGPLLYAFSNQELKDMKVIGNYVRDLHNLGSATGYGISTQCNNDAMADKTGNVFMYNIVENASIGYRMQFEDEQKVYNNIAVGCDKGFQSSRSISAIGFRDPEEKVNEWARNDIYIGQDSGAGARVRSLTFTEGFMSSDGLFTYAHLHTINFTDGKEDPGIDTIIVGNQSAVRASVRKIHIVNGSWENNDTRGIIYMDKESPSFIEDEYFDIEEGTRRVLKLDGAEYRHSFKEGEYMYHNESLIAQVSFVGTVGPDVVARNNIFYQSSEEDVDFNTGGSDGHYASDFDYNVYYPAANASDITMGNHSNVANPRFMDVTEGDYSIRNGSPVIDSGINLSYTFSNGLYPDSIWPDYVRHIHQGYHGDAWEIGPFVYVDGPLEMDFDCAHPADNNPCDEKISFLEICNYVDVWLSGEASLNSLIRGVHIWKG